MARILQKYIGTYEFEVKAGKSYKVYCDGSKLGFYGFSYKVDLSSEEGGEVKKEYPKYVYNFAGAQAAGETPLVKLNQSGGFYIWERDDKVDSKRQDFRGYTNYKGSNLAAACHVWRRTDAYDNASTWVDGGLYCPNDREMVIDGVAHGKSGHAAREEGVNAIYEALDDLVWLRDYRFKKESALLGATKMTVTVVNSGTQHNVIPDECHFVIDVRTNEFYQNEYLFSFLQKHMKKCELKARSFRLSSSHIANGHDAFWLSHPQRSGTHAFPIIQAGTRRV